MLTTGEKLQIHAPHLLSRRRRVGDAIFTGLMWILYSYLWAPFISLVAWLLGFEFAYDVMVRAGGIKALKEVMWSYGLVVAGISLVVMMWSLVNRYRFAGHDRRLPGRVVTDDELADYFTIEAADLRRMRMSPTMRISLSDAGAVHDVTELGADNDQRRRRDQSERSQITKPNSSAR